jgi:hypothetical protein
MEFLPPLVQWTSHVKANAKEAVIRTPAKVNVVNCGGLGGATGASRDWPVLTGPCNVWELRSCEATMIYRNRSRNFALSVLPSLEVTTLCTMQRSVKATRIVPKCESYSAGIMYGSHRIVSGHG